MGKAHVFFLYLFYMPRKIDFRNDLRIAGSPIHGPRSYPDGHQGPDRFTTAPSGKSAGCGVALLSSPNIPQRPPVKAVILDFAEEPEHEAHTTTGGLSGHE